MKKALLYLMALLYIAAGINHFVHPQMYLKIMPPWLPWHSFLVLLSGILEILFGCLLLIPSTRRAGAWGLIFLLIAVFPANIQMTLNYWKEGHPQFWITILRLPVQILLIAWAYWYTRRKGS